MRRTAPLPFACDSAPELGRRHSLRDIALWFQALRRNPRAMGAILPSGRVLARALAHHAVRGRVDTGIVEVGAGSGTVTDALVRLTDGRHPIRAIEANALLAARLQRRLPQVEVFGGLFEDVYEEAFAGLQNAVVVSCVPLFSLGEEARAAYFAALANAVDRGWIGRYVQFTYWPVLPWTEARALCGAKPRLVARNCPPAWVWGQDHCAA